MVESKIGQELERLMNEYQDSIFLLKECIGKGGLFKVDAGVFKETKRTLYNAAKKLDELSDGKIKVNIPEDKIKELENKLGYFDELSLKPQYIIRY